VGGEYNVANWGRKGTCLPGFSVFSSNLCGRMSVRLAEANELRVDVFLASPLLPLLPLLVGG